VAVLKEPTIVLLEVALGLVILVLLVLAVLVVTVLLVRTLLALVPLGLAITAPVVRMGLVLEAVLWVVQAR
jgi:hypothetical protein